MQIRTVMALVVCASLFQAGVVLADHATIDHHHAVKHAVHHKSSQVTAVINLNSADVKSLAALNGIGEKKAKAIIAYRHAHGDFKTLSDLTQIKGIGSKWLARLQRKNPGRILIK